MWGKTTNGKSVPLNTKPIKAYLLLDADKNIYTLETVYESHFATCKDADKFRKKPGETAPSDDYPRDIQGEDEYNDGGDKNS
jgi:hypothetical protein